MDTNIDKIESNDRRCVLAIGMFDGAHIGHSRVFEKAKELAKKLNAEPCVLTFFPHPSKVVNMGRPAAKLIFEGKARDAKFEEAGIKCVFVKNFTRDFADFTPEEFANFLEKKFPKLMGIVTGSNFVFGRGASGNAQSLSEIAMKRGWQYAKVDGIQKLGRRISSSRLRDALVRGDMKTFETLAGYTYAAYGTTASGKQLGRKIGFPTINLPWNPDCKPPYGVYAAYLEMPEGKFAGVANYGISPTVNKDDASPLIEINLFEPKQVEAGSLVKITLIEFLRPEKKFESIEELVEQISKDVSKAKHTLGITIG